MKKFTNVPSRVKQSMQQQAFNDEVRPIQDRRVGSARGPRNIAKENVAFGRSNSFNNKNSANLDGNLKNQAHVMRVADLNKNALEKFNMMNKPGQNVEDAIVIQNENENTGNTALPPRTPNYGKTPKYIQKFKEEAKQKEDARLEAKAARNRPPGTKVMAEEDRIKTLEDLKKNRNEIN